MPPSLRRRGQPPTPQFHDSDEELDQLEDELEEDLMPEEESDDGLEEEENVGEEEDDEEEEEPLGSPTHSSLTHHAPIPPHFREISTLASWTVSSSKPGCSIPQLRSPNSSLFWQSDGPQPHYLNIHFFKLVRIVGLRLYLDFEADESYTPTRIVFLAGSGGNDLVEWGEMRLEQPRGWIWADFSGVGDADDDDDDYEDDDEEGDEGHNAENDRQSTSPAPRTAPRERAGSDFENTQPTHHHDREAREGTAGTEGTHPNMHADLALDLDADEDSMMLDYPPQHLQHQPQPHNTSPSLHRTHPRRPLQHLAPGASPPAGRAAKPRKVKMPVLRAHLVQIKILENHQNGKDTHLRGLQIFARDDDGERAREVRLPSGRKSVGGVDGVGIGGRNGGAMGAEGVWMGKSSAWDVDPVIR